MPPKTNVPRTLHSIVDPFVRGVGGELISELIENKNPQSNADYLFRAHNVVAEMKALEAGGFADSFHRKLSELLARWHKERRFMVFGTVQIQSGKLPDDCREEMFSAMAESLQKHVVAAANKQIKSSKRLLNLPEAKGLLWVASDGNDQFSPETVWYLLTRILRKKKEDGGPAYSSINGIAYFNPRMLARVPNLKEPALLWFSGTRNPQHDQNLQACLNVLNNAWPQYVARAQGIKVRGVDAKPDGVTFWDAAPKVPLIEIDYK